MFKVCKVITNTNTTNHLLETTGINLNVYVIVGCDGGDVVKWQMAPDIIERCKASA